MKFYEFNDGFGYYALIGADTAEAAIQYYKEIVSDIDDEDAFPDEITEETVRARLSESLVITQQDKEDFERDLHGAEPFIIFVDGSLI